MQYDRYKNWLKNYSGLALRPQDDMLSRGRRIERDLRVDLDEEYESDRCNGLLATMEYTTEDAARRTPLPGKLTINGNRVRVMSALRHAVKKYVEFRSQPNG